MLLKVLFILVVAGIGLSDGPAKLSVTLLYESRCPDSRSFVQRQLQPAMSLLHDQVKLRLVPFGKAYSIENGYGGFECQHGATECRGNLVQECVLSVMSNHDDLEKAAYVACEMDTLAAALGSPTCIQEANVSTDAVNECLSTGKGVLLQLESERITKIYKPHFIPTVIIDGIYNQILQDMSQIDLIGTLCAALRMRHTDSRSCSQYYHDLSLKNVIG